MQISIIERARAYLARMPVSVQYQGGSDAAFAVALVLVKGFDLSEQDALPLFIEWNAGCLPPWQVSDLLHKLRDAAKSDKPSGYLLTDHAPTRDRTAPDFENDAEKEARKKVSQRKAWPTFKTLKPAGIETIAKLRHMMPDAVDLAHQHGFLKGAEIDGHRCFIMHEGTFAQARRLDGLPLTMHNGTESKPKNLLGSQGAFIGQRWLGNTSHVLLVEGVIGLVEALAAFLLAEDVKKNWSVIAATSAGSRFVRDPELLARLAGRHVRIIPDNDEAGTGYAAAASWMADLKNAGAMVDAKALPDGCKDLGDIIAAPELHKETLTALFQ
jgi:hypothetical protein